AAAAAGAGLGAELDLLDRGQVLVADRVADGALVDVVTGADLRLVRDRGEHTAGALGVRLAEDQLVRRQRQRLAALGEHRQLAVLAGVADEDAAEQPAAVEAEDQLLVRPLEGVLVRQGPRPLTPTPLPRRGEGGS